MSQPQARRRLWHFHRQQQLRQQESSEPRLTPDHPAVETQSAVQVNQSNS